MGSTHAKNTGNHRGLVMVLAGVFAVCAVSANVYASTHQVDAPAVATSVVTTTASASPSSSATASNATSSATASSSAVPTGVAPAPEQAAPAPRQTAAPAPEQADVTTPSRRPAAPRSGSGRVMAASRPVSLSIPAINVKSSGMLHLGQTAQGALQVPPPGRDYDKVAWYRNSPTPGSLGPAVLVGHVDSAAGGPSVFYRLSALKRGDLVWVTRADRSVAVFRVDDVKRFPKRQFPTSLVYADTDHAALRIITCGGAFDPGVGHYVDNTVVLASLI